MWSIQTAGEGGGGSSPVLRNPQPTWRNQNFKNVYAIQKDNTKLPDNVYKKKPQAPQ